jgi:hypothetical protein
VGEEGKLQKAKVEKQKEGTWWRLLASLSLMTYKITSQRRSVHVLMRFGALEKLGMHIETHILFVSF